MNLKKSLLVITAVASLGLNAFAAAPSTYQVTGPVLALTDSIITVEKGKEKWEIARNADSKVAGDLKVGSKVTITYTMTASAISVKADKADKADKKTTASSSAAPAAGTVAKP